MAEVDAACAPPLATPSSTVNRTSVVVTALSSGSAASSLLEIGGLRLLLDAGLPESLSVSSLERVVDLASLSPFDGALVSHADLRHIGGIAYLHARGALNCPIYATLPVVKLGQMSLYDAQLNHKFRGLRAAEGGEGEGEGSEVPFTLDDVDAVFRKCVELKYSQQVRAFRRS